ncbi:YkgJ family cysteine cluster protein [Uliginosibacterium sediminicola]|uniref:YkgJ family cysteine cluster protein n=1 Tax=Uliginosibacterium sediminicola TaxID=2024550 RepID=A0ABU9Z2W5_9RHOO
MDSTQSLVFFKSRHAAFAATLAAKAGDLLAGLLDQAFADFDLEVDQQCRGKPALDCHKGCATCCTVRVTASAPEVLLVARHLREQVSPEACGRLVRRLLEADGLTRDLDEAERVQLRHRCPFVEKGACVIYAARPLACRGHASYSRRACVQAAAGRLTEVPYSIPHQNVRSLVQNAMQSALRDARLAWASYELNHALRIALSDASSEARWCAGEDVFAAAQVNEISAAEMAAGFDRIKLIVG